MESSILPESEPNNADLALSYLNHRDSELTRELKSAENSLKFSQNYTPSISVRPPNIEIGSTDWSDWETAELEDEEWINGGQDEEIQRIEGEMYDLSDRLSEVIGLKTLVKEGDTELTDYYAGLERERRKKLEEQARANRDTESKPT